MKRTMAIVICVIFPASGLIRIGVGGILIGQSAGWRALGGEAEEALFVNFMTVNPKAVFLALGVLLTLALWRANRPEKPGGMLLPRQSPEV